MSTFADRITPAYVRLSGEIADQAILDTLARIYPDAAIGHALRVDGGRRGLRGH